jgi:hypothetical protein
MAQLTHFYHPLQMAVDKMALSPQTAWELDLSLTDPAPYTQQEIRQIAWVNLVNSPVKYLQAQ